MKKYIRGFTLMEMAIVMAILILLVAIVVPSFSRYRKVQILKSETEHLVLLLREARSRTLSSENSLQYGVYVTSNSVTMFSGSAYVSGASGNQTTAVDSAVTLTPSLAGGGNTILFKRLSGATDQSGTIVVAVVGDTTQHTVTISSLGLIASN